MIKNAKKNNKKTVILLVSIVVLMFGFGFAMVPLYNLICDVVGLKSTGKVALPSDLKPDSSRFVTIEFDGVVNDNLPWKFEPSKRKMTVSLGKLFTTNYRVTNMANETITAQAIPNLLPWFANKYFNKIECFCFNNQTLKANETVDMPVRFYVSSDIPKDIKTLHLSYTFMNIDSKATHNMDMKKNDHNNHNH